MRRDVGDEMGQEWEGKIGKGKERVFGVNILISF